GLHGRERGAGAGRRARVREREEGRRRDHVPDARERARREARARRRAAGAFDGALRHRPESRRGRAGPRGSAGRQAPAQDVLRQPGDLRERARWQYRGVCADAVVSSLARPMRELEELLGLFVAAVILAAGARRAGAPYPVFLALGGGVIAFLPGTPSFAL